MTKTVCDQRRSTDGVHFRRSEFFPRIFFEIRIHQAPTARSCSSAPWRRDCSLKGSEILLALPVKQLPTDTDGAANSRCDPVHFFLLALAKPQQVDDSFARSKVTLRHW